MTKELSKAQSRMLDQVRRDGERMYNGKAERTIKILADLGLVTYRFGVRRVSLSGRYVEEYTVWLK